MILTPHRSDVLLLREAFGHYPSGVAALAARVNDDDTVLVASSFTVGVSLEPPLVMFAVQKTSTTWPALRAADRIGVSVLAEDQGGLCRQLAAKDKTTRWDGVGVDRTESGAVFISDASVSLECRLYDEHPAGDHDIVVLEVLALQTSTQVDPLVFHGSRFRPMT